MELDVSQVRQLVAAIERSGGRIGGEAARGVRKAAQQVKTAAQATAPVRTGALRSSISVSSGDGITAEIGSSLRYAGYVEFGTSRTPPQPYMGPALDSVADSFLESMAEAAERALG